MRICAVLCVRNEAAFLLDWLAHHKACGITDFVVLSNDCQDGTDLLLDRLAALGEVTHIRNDGPYDDKGIQFTGLKRADKCEAVTQSDWVLSLDVDEFVNVHTGDRTLGALIAALPDAGAITLTWRLFGNAGHVPYQDIPVPQHFTRAAPAVMHWPWRAAMFKTLYRTGTYRNLGVHRPRNPKGHEPAWFDGAGRQIDDVRDSARVFSTFGRDNYGLAQLNHYPLGAMESYVLKAARGRAVHSDHMLGMDYWVERNFNTVEDTTISAVEAPVAQIRERLAADPELAQLHSAGVAWRKERFQELMLQEPFRALMGRLLMTPGSQPTADGASRFLLHHAHRAQRAAGPSG